MRLAAPVGFEAVGIRPRREGRHHEPGLALILADQSQDIGELRPLLRRQPCRGTPAPAPATGRCRAGRPGRSPRAARSERSGSSGGRILALAVHLQLHGQRARVVILVVEALGRISGRAQAIREAHPGIVGARLGEHADREGVGPVGSRRDVVDLEGRGDAGADGVGPAQPRLPRCRRSTEKPGQKCDLLVLYCFAPPS